MAKQYYEHATLMEVHLELENNKSQDLAQL